MATFMGCTSSPLAKKPSFLSPDVLPSSTDPANAYLYLSNQTSRDGWGHVVLAVYVDGELAVRRTMKSVFLNAYPAAHGFPDEVLLRLAPGPHTIRVVAEGANASAETHVTVGAAPVYVDAAFFYGSDCLQESSAPTTSVTINVSAERPGFC